MKQKIWIINQYAMPPEYEQRVRHLMFARYLQQDGYDVTVIGSSELHNMNVSLISGKAPYIIRYYDGIRYLHIRTGRYHDNGLKRIVAIMTFQWRIRLHYHAMVKKLGKPDVILFDDPAVPFGAAQLFLRKHIPFIKEIRDLWPQSIVDFGVATARNPMVQVLYRLEKSVYAKADALVFAMEGGRDYIIEKGWDNAHGGPIDLEKVFYISNGVDLDKFDFDRENYSLEDDDLLNTDTFKVVYVGSVRRANGLHFLVEAAAYLQNSPSVLFLIYGDGDGMDMLRQECQNRNLTNVRIKGRVAKKYIPFILSHSDLNILNYQQSPIWNYGSSNNKLFEYLASGKPILSNIDIKYSPIRAFQCGMTGDFSNPADYARAIEDFHNMPIDHRSQMGENARRASLNYDYKVLEKKLVDVIESL